MGDGIYAALSGAVAQANALETTASNLANASTAGYQRIRPVFHEALAAASQQHGGALRFTTISETPMDTSVGPTRVTERALDFVLPPKAYLAVSGANGERFTRAGSLALGADGILKTVGGAPVLDEQGKKILAKPEAGEVKVLPTGEVRQGENVVGRLRVVTFDRPEMLQHEGGTLLVAPATAGTAKLSKEPLEIGSIEESNASVVSSMTDLVAATRNFDAFQRAIDAFREIDRKVVSTVPNGSP